MFVTHTPFKHRMQLDDRSTLWTSMEVALHWSWYLATVQDPHEPVQRTFALGTNDDLLLFAEQEPLGPLIALQLMVASRPGSNWQLIPIATVARLTEADNSRPLAVVTSDDGTHYGGVPVGRIYPRTEELTPLIRLNVPAPCGVRSRASRRAGR
ncbi:hypothetical protein [Piscinibacter terrae]|uniref:Uncharacterized protein n=1 Tax=Piscinibacter terrae TaxID=2496871 RepID=A0A3N7HME0_9BURK|nr:hypothetical protein [Albitalea terrae]RQP23338.1 hypothetical protein DZC73_19780 [Albitalea terrae]